MTYPEDKLSEIMDIAADYESPVGADFVGLHLEGPFINPNRVGAQNSDYVQKPDADMLLRCRSVQRDVFESVMLHQRQRMQLTL